MVENLTELFVALWGLVVSLWAVAVSLGTLILPWLPLIAWIVFWLLAVDWVRLRRVMLQGGWIPVLLIGLVTVLVWGTIAPPESGRHELLGLSVSNFVGKTVYVSALFSIAFLCGAVQLTGVVDRWRPVETAERISHPTEMAHEQAHH